MLWWSKKSTGFVYVSELLEAQVLFLAHRQSWCHKKKMVMIVIMASLPPPPPLPYAFPRDMHSRR